MWGGRFAEGPASVMRKINASIPFDKRLWRQDIVASRAHVAMLGAQGLLSEKDTQAIDQGLQQIGEEYEAKGIVEDLDLEDIHMHVENRLAELIGPVAGRLHTARSRNDQVATDFKLWVRDAIDVVDAGLNAFQRALVDRAEEHAETVMPGFTHLQSAQPVTLGHHLMAYYEMAERLAEECIIWASQPFGFVRFPDAYSTGSSIMPQKRNPDVAELVRGHAARIAGAMTALTVTMKGLPLAYAKDMQDDKPPVFEAHDLLALSLKAMTGVIEMITFVPDRMRTLAEAGHATATDLADWLVREADVPFREAHHIVGNAVKLADERGVALAELSLNDLQGIDVRIDSGVFDVLIVEASVASRTSHGGTAPDQVRARMAEARTQGERMR